MLFSWFIHSKTCIWPWLVVFLEPAAHKEEISMNRIKREFTIKSNSAIQLLHLSFFSMKYWICRKHPKLVLWCNLHVHRYKVKNFVDWQVNEKQYTYQYDDDDVEGSGLTTTTDLLLDIVLVNRKHHKKNVVMYKNSGIHYFSMIYHVTHTS